MFDDDEIVLDEIWEDPIDGVIHAEMDGTEVAVELADDGTHFFKIGVPYPGPQWVAVGFRQSESDEYPQQTGFEWFLEPLGEDGQPRKGTGVYSWAGTDYGAVSKEFRDIRADLDFLHDWLREKPAFQDAFGSALHGWALVAIL